MKRSQNFWYRLASQAAFLSLLVNMIFPAGVARAEAAAIGNLRTWENVITSTSAELHFSFSAAGYFRIDYGTTSGSYPSSSSQSTLTNTSYPYYYITISGLNPNTTYYYRLATKGLSSSATEWGYTSESSFTTAAPDTTPPTVSGVYANNITETGASINFSLSEIGYVKIEYGPNNTFTSSTQEYNISALGASITGLPNLTAGTTYSYRIVARDSVGNSSTSASYTFTTTAPPDTTPPSVSGTTVTSTTSSSASITITMNEAGYAKVEYGTGGSFALSTAETSIAASVSSTIYLSGLTAGTTYSYRVVARDSANNITTTPPGYFSTASTGSNTAPTVSGVHTMYVYATSAQLMWGCDQSCYGQVEYSTSPSYAGSTFTAWTTTLSSSPTVDLTGLTSNTTYYTRVYGKNSNGLISSAVSFNFYTTSSSGTATSTPPTADVTPPTITNISSSNITSSSANITFTSSEAGYAQVEYGVNGGYLYASAQVAVTANTPAVIYLSGENSATTYNYRVVARDSAGNTTTSSSYTFTTTGSTTQSSPIGWWKFDGTGDGATLTSPSAAAVGGATFRSSGGVSGGYAYVPGASDYVRVPYNSAFDLPNSFTVEFWFRQRTNQGFNQNLVYKGSAPNTYNFNIFRYLWNQYNNGAVITGFTSASTGYWTQTSNPNEPAHNAWHHVAFTKSTTGSAYYIDGNLIHSSSQSDAAKTPASDIIIADSAVDTDIDELKIYNRALSAGEVSQSYSSLAPAPPADTTAPTIIGVSASGLTWNSASIYFAANEGGYAKVEYGPNSIFTLSTPESSVVANISTSIYLSGLVSNTNYGYRVVARDSANNTVTSPTYTFTTLSSTTATSTPPTTVDTTAPVISGVHVMYNTTASTQIMWSTDDQSYGKVEYGETTAYGQFTPWSTSLSYSPAVDITTGLITGKTYHYRVYSRNQSGLESTSNDYTFTASSTNTPPPVGAFTVDSSRLEPRSAATEVPTSLSKIHVEFTKAIDAGSITGSAVSLNYLGSTSASLSSSFDLFSNGFNFILPTNSLKPGLTYNFTIRGTVRASTGETLGSDYAFSFTTAKTTETAGQAVIKGTVKDSAGAPVAGAYVSLRSGGAYYTSYGYSQSTQTTSYGEYNFANLAAGSYTIEVYPPSSSGGTTRPDPVSVILTAGETVIRDFTLISSNKYIKGTVKFSDGKPVTDAEVSAYRREGNGWVSGMTDTTGTFSLAVQTGSWMVSIRPRSVSIPFSSVTYQPITYPTWIYTNPPQEVYIDESNVSKEVNFVVPRQGATVSGNLTRADGGFLSSGVATVRFLGQTGFSVSATIDSTGRFTTPINPGTYKLFVDVFDPDLAGPEWPPISIAPGETRDLGTIYLKNLEAVVSGRVTTIDGQGVPRVKVSGWKMNSAESNSAITDEKGEYSMKVSPGDWTLSITPSPDQPYSTTAPPQTIRVKGGRLTGINFVLTASDGLVNGVVTDGRGNILSDFYGFVSVSSRAGGYRLPHGAPVERGQFTLRLPSGSYLLHLELPPNAVSGKPAPVPVTVASGESRKVEFVIKEEASGAIIGFLTDRAGNKIINVPFKVFATGASGGWYSASIDLALGYYKLNLPAGTWYLDYDLDDDTGQYQRPFDRKRKITVRAGQIVNLDLPVLEQNGRISGMVRDTEGNGLSNIWVAVSSQPFSNFNRATAASQRYLNGVTSDETGQFSLPVLPGRYYVRAFVPPALGFANPEEQGVTVAGGEEVQVELTLRSLTTTISGRTTIAGVPNWAFVWAWSNKGGYTESYADEKGTFKLKVAANDVWHVGAMSELNRDTYKASEVAITVSRPGVNIPLNLDLAPLGVKLPEPVSVATEAEQMTVVANDNGAKLVMPANAASTEGSLSVSIAPAIITPSQGADRVVGVGYEMEVRNAQGQEVNTFNSELTVSIPYDPAELTRLNLRPADLGLRYWDEVSSTWREVSNAIVDEINHVITASLAHLTRFAVVAASDTTPPAAPTQVKTKVASDGIIITWIKPKDKDLQYVKIYRSTSKDALGEVVANNLTAATYKDSGLKRGATYYYLARAVDLSGNESTNTSSVAVEVKGKGTLGKATVRGVVAKIEKITLKGSITDVNLAASTLEIKVESSSVKDLRGKKVVVKFTPKTVFKKAGKAVKTAEIKAGNTIDAQATREAGAITLVSANVTAVKVSIKAELKVSEFHGQRSKLKVKVLEARGAVAGVGVEKGKEAFLNIEGVTVNTNGKSTPVENLAPQKNVTIEGVVENGGVTVTKIIAPETPKVKVQPTPQGRIGDEAASVTR